MVASEIEQVPLFALSANWLCLDFTNTLDDRLTEDVHDNLNSYVDLVAWSRQAGLVTDAGAERLLEEARRNSEEARGVLLRARDLREVMYRIFLAITEGAQPAEADLYTLNAALAKAMAHARVVGRDGGFVWSWEDGGCELDSLLWPVIRSAADLLTSSELEAVRVCAAEDCSWLFLDTSKNHTRRWCSMKSCGNRAKARRHYKKEKEQA
ncbi:MAG TPA: ABATE domain-containing protein [Ktedonobacteraceae bacterium]|nr:ABATE domain-containing protein [Ktedonobacteraceae bacterium]